MIIPFFIPHSGCPHQCVFCNQKNITGISTPFDTASLPQRIEEYLKTARPDQPDQVAFYGGSFTALPLETQKLYFEAARPFIRSGRVHSIRLSTRPDCIGPEVLHLLKEHHVETVELGAQSMNDRVLMLSGRGHTAAATADAVTILRKFPFKVGLQFMPGLPGDSEDIFLDTVHKAIALKPDFVRIYPAVVIKDTPLAAMYNTGRYTPLSLDHAVALCKQALLKFESAGIAVVRIGLQPTEELEKPGTIIAGPYHPAFRQLVESSILLDTMRGVLADGERVLPEVTFLVNPADVSNAIGQNRSNIDTLKKQFRLKDISLQPDDSIPARTVKAAMS